ncbi:MAG: hypothetical protein ABSH20_27500, partial [Tepidisphaeraceae bacterium]
ELTVPAAPTSTPPGAYSQSTPLARLMATVMDPAVIQLRNAVLAAVRGQGYPALDDPSLPVLAAYADALYQAPPMLAAVGTGINAISQSMNFAAPVLPAVSDPAPSIQPAHVRLLGAANRYVGGNPVLRTTASGASLRLASARVTGRWVAKTRNGTAHPGLNAFRGAALTTSSNEEPTVERVQIFAGTAALVDLHQPAGSQGRMDVQGKVPVRLIELNSHDEVIGDRVVAAGTRTFLDAATAKAALCGVNPVDNGQRLVGWQRDTALTQIGRYSFVGEGCMVRPQAPVLWKQDGRYVEHGLMEAAQILRLNTVQVGGSAQPGWLETVLEGPLGSVSISVRAENIEQVQSLDVRLAWSAEAWAPVYAGAAVAASVQPA